MRILEVQQGSSQWQAERARRFTASEAPAMMGASKYTSRGDLLRQKATGLIPEVSAQQQALYDRGHATEAAARALLEPELGELYPITAVHDTDDRLLASVDGITIDDETLFEHKLWSEPLAAQVQAGELEPHYYWQLEQELLVTGAQRVVFVTSDGTRERWAQMEYRPVPGRREALLAGWEQFARDLEAYVPPAASSVEKVVAEPVEALPAPVVQVTGQIALQDNFKVFEERLRHFLEHRLIRQPKTDQDFADLDGQIKAMKKAREALKAAEAQMLAQVEPVDQAKKTKDMLDKLLQQNCSMAEKLLAEEKERRRGEIVAGGRNALEEHVRGLNRRLGGNYMPPVVAPFGDCIKGLKSLASMEDKVATLLANTKILANEIADRIDTNLKTLATVAPEHAALFPDRAAIVQKAPEDLQALVRARVAEHDAAVKRRAEEAAERERARIRAEEEARAREQARQDGLRIQRELEERARAEGEIPYVEATAAAKAGKRLQTRAHPNDQWRTVVSGEELGGVNAYYRLAPQEPAREEAAALDEQERQQPPAGSVYGTEEAATSSADFTRSIAAGPAVIPMPTRAPAAPAGPPTLKLGEINARLAPLSVTAEGLAQLGFPVVATDRSAKLYRESDWIAMVDAMTAHLEDNVRAGVRATA